MGESKTSKGVSGNNNAKRKTSKPMPVKEVSVEELERKLQKYSGESPIYVAGIDFGVRERSSLEISNTNSADSTGDTDTSTKNNSDNDLIIADNTVTKSIETVLGPGILIGMKKRVKSKESRENNQKDEQEKGRQETRE